MIVHTHAHGDGLKALQTRKHGQLVMDLPLHAACAEIWSSSATRPMNDKMKIAFATTEAVTPWLTMQSHMHKTYVYIYIFIFSYVYF